MDTVAVVFLQYKYIQTIFNEDLQIEWKMADEMEILYKIFNL